MNGLKIDVLARKGKFHKNTAVKTGFSKSDAEFVSVSVLDVVGTEEFASKMKVSQIEDGIEIGIVKKIDQVETAVWYFLNKEEIDIFVEFLQSLKPGIDELYKENTGK